MILNPLRDPLDGPEAPPTKSYAERRREDDLAEARQEVLEWVDEWLSQRVSVPRELRDSLWEAGCQKFDVIQIGG